MSKAKKPNEIREEVRKQMAAKYKQDVEHWRDMYHTTMCYQLRDENIKLKEQVDAQKDWIERLMQFMDMPDEQRSKAVKEYVENKRMSEEFLELFSPYFETLNRLNILSW